MNKDKVNNLHMRANYWFNKSQEAKKELHTVELNLLRAYNE